MEVCRVSAHEGRYPRGRRRQVMIRTEASAVALCLWLLPQAGVSNDDEFGRPRCHLDRGLPAATQRSPRSLPDRATLRQPRRRQERRRAVPNAAADQDASKRDARPDVGRHWSRWIGSFRDVSGSRLQSGSELRRPSWDRPGWEGRAFRCASHSSRLSYLLSCPCFSAPTSCWLRRLQQTYSSIGPALEYAAVTPSRSESGTSPTAAVPGGTRSTCSGQVASECSILMVEPPNIGSSGESGQTG